MHRLCEKLPCNRFNGSDLTKTTEENEKGVTEISLDAIDLGRPLYETLGFCASDECMVMNLVG